MIEHILYKTGDADAPDAIKDRNGHVVLGLCRRCNSGEVELSEPCEISISHLRAVARKHAQHPSQIPVELRRYFFALEMCGEAGETANVFKKEWRGDDLSSKELHARACEELSDTVIAALLTAELLDFDVISGAMNGMLNFERSIKWKHMLQRVDAFVGDDK